MWNSLDSADSAQIAVLGVAYDAHSSYMRGPADAPPLIRQAFFSDHWNSTSEAGVDLGAPGVFADGGDITPSAGTFVADIAAAAGRALAGGRRLITLGGDHSISYPLLQAVAAQHGPVTLLHFDAHADLYDTYDGDPLSHASPFARIMEAGLAARLTQIGVRTLNRHQCEQARRFGVRIVEMKDWNDARTFAFEGPLYVSFDMDCLDPASAPGVSHWEPGGFSVRQVLRVIQSLQAPIVAADIVEYNPRRDVSGITATVAAKVFKELAAAMLAPAA